jgi:hypothetical protein
MRCDFIVKKIKDCNLPFFIPINVEIIVNVLDLEVVWYSVEVTGFEWFSEPCKQQPTGPPKCDLYTYCLYSVCKMFILCEFCGVTSSIGVGRFSDGYYLMGTIWNNCDIMRFCMLIDLVKVLWWCARARVVRCDRYQFISLTHTLASQLALVSAHSGTSYMVLAFLFPRNVL